MDTAGSPEKASGGGHRSCWRILMPQWNWSWSLPQVCLSHTYARNWNGCSSMAASETPSNSHSILTIHSSSASLITPKVSWGSEDSPLHQQSPHPTTSTAPSFSNAVMTLVGYFIEIRRDSSNSSFDWTFVHRLPSPSPKLGASWILSS